MLPYLRLVRVGALFSPAADVVAGACLAGLPWSSALVRACVASVLVYAAGMALNDHADREIDRVHRPERPLPSGQIRPATALILGLSLLVGGVALSPTPVWHGLIAALVLAYDYALKSPSDPALQVAGAVTMGSLRALNLLTGATLAASLTTDVRSASWWRHGIAWPDLLSESGRPHLYAAAAYAVAIVCVTILGIYEDRRSVRARAVQSLLSLAPLAWLLALLGTAHNWWTPAVAGALVVAFFARNRRVATWDAPSIRGAMLWLLLGTSLWDALLCLGQDRWPEALAIAATVPLARAIARRVAPTT